MIYTCTIVVVVVVVVVVVIIVIVVIVISFNPVARTSTVKTLQRISDTEALVPVNKSVLESIADCCIGDIRAAINILQFTAAKGTLVVPPPCSIIIWTPFLRHFPDSVQTYLCNSLA